jgi:two-component system, NtrC family, response regulator GlrR
MSDSEPPNEFTKLITHPRASRDVKVRPRHQVRWKDAAGDHVVTLEGRSIAGAAAGAGIVIADPTVSRLHAEFETRGEAVWVHDCGSKNGTFVEGVQVIAARVPDGGKVRLGETTLTVNPEPIPQLVRLWKEDRFGPLVGGSAAMRELYAQLARVAAIDSSVLVQGETGTGKELVARAIHDASPRAKQPFVIIDCAALPEHLLESELFGHTKGAFTGAATARGGAIEAADQGTVFLDEIGELPLAMQPKLLRVLESRAVRRIGETNYRAIDVRFISATHRDLGTMVNAGAFREDLYFRLAVIPISVPPLRDRAADIAMLVEHFRGGSNAPSFSREISDALASRPWLGNVRELRNFVERAHALGPQEALAMNSLDPSRPPPSTSAGTSNEHRFAPDIAEPASSPAGELPEVSIDLPYKEAREAWLEHVERSYLHRLLERHGRNVAAAAQAAGIDRTYIYRLIKKHRI